MPGGASPSPLLLDTSAAVALILGSHSHHAPTFEALVGKPLGLAGHAAFETFSVLTRLPLPDRLSASAAARVLAVNFPHTRHLGPGAARQLLNTLGTGAVTGGAVYDALVAAAAVEHDLHLVTRDVRALDTYREVGATVVLL